MNDNETQQEGNNNPLSLADVYKNGEMVHEDAATKSKVVKGIKLNIWPYFKFINLTTINSINLGETNTVLYRLMKHCNIEHKSIPDKARFFNRYGKDIPSIISIQRSNTQQWNKKSVVKGMFYNRFCSHI